MLTVKQLIAQLQTMPDNTIVEGFAHNNATVCNFDYTDNAVELMYAEDSDAQHDTVVLHFNVLAPTC